MMCPYCDAPLREGADFCVRCGGAVYPLAPGRVLLDRYEIQDSVGSGRRGVVYRATDRSLGAPVAVRVLRRDLPEAWVRRIRTEIKDVRRVRNNFICATYEYSEEGPIRFLTMELVEGETLQEVIRTHGPLNLHEGLRLAGELAEGLCAIHQARMLHLGITSRQVRVDRRGRARLMGFGIAPSPLEEAPSNARLGGMARTSEYLSPEARSGSVTDERSDLYSLGVVVHEMFHGDVPCRADIKAPGLLKPIRELPHPLRTLIRLLLEPEPAARLQTARDLKARIAAIERRFENPFPLAETLMDGGYERSAPAARSSERIEEPGRALADVLRILSTQERPTTPRIQASGSLAETTPALELDLSGGDSNQPIEVSVRNSGWQTRDLRESSGPPPIALPLEDDRTLHVPLQPLRSPSPRRRQSPLLWALALVAAAGVSMGSLALMWWGFEVSLSDSGSRPEGPVAAPSPPAGAKAGSPSLPGRAPGANGRSGAAPRRQAVAVRKPEIRPITAAGSAEPMGHAPPLAPTASPPVFSPGPPPPPPPAPAARGTLKVDACPFADVAIDGQTLGRTPLTLEVEEGSHLVTFSLRDVPPVQERVEVRSGVTSVVSTTFGPAVCPPLRGIGTMPTPAPTPKLREPPAESNETSGE